MTAALQLPGLLDEKQDWTVDDLVSLPKDLGQRDEPRPDISVGHMRSGLRSPFPFRDVILVGEVLSADSEPIDRGCKMSLYARGGIPSYWIIDPLAERVPSRSICSAPTAPTANS